MSLVDLEARVLGAAIQRADLIPHDLEPGDFFDLKHRLVFSAIRNLQDAGTAIDVTAVEERLHTDGNDQALDVHGEGEGSAFQFLEDLIDVSPKSRLLTADWFTTNAGRIRTARRNRDAKLSAVISDPWKAELAKARQDIERAIGEKISRDRQPLFAIDTVDLLSTEFPPAQWLISGLLTRNGTAVAAGEPKAGIKTWMLIEIAIAIATGTKAFGEFYAERGVAAIFFAEDHAQSARNRIRSLLAGANRMLRPGSLLLQPRGEYIDILKDEDLAWIVASARRLGKLDLLVLDPMRDVHSGEEDKSDSMSDVMRRIRLLGELIGCTVAVSHHTPKVTKDNATRRPGQNLRGSSAIHGSIDSGLYVTPGDGDGTNSFSADVVSQVKSARSAGAFTLKLTIDDDANGEAVSAQWEKSDIESKKPSDRHPDDDVVYGWVCELAIRGIVTTRTTLRQREDRPLGERKVTSALDRLCSAKRLALRHGLVVVPVQEECSAND